MATLLEVRRLVLEQGLGEERETVTTAKSVDATYATRQLILGGIVNAKPSSWLDRSWVHIRDGAQAKACRQVNKSGWNAATSTVLLDSALPAAVESGVHVEITRWLPARRSDTLPGLVDCINQALRQTWVEYTLEITAVANQLRYPLDVATWPWLADLNRIIGVADPKPDAQRPWPLSYRSFRVEYDDDALCLFLGSAYNAGDVFGLRVRMPGWARIKSSGVWGWNSDRLSGMDNDTDECLVDALTLSYGAMRHAYAAMRERGVGPETAVAQAEEAKWAAKFQRAKGTRLPQRRALGAPGRAPSLPWNRWIPI